MSANDKVTARRHYKSCGKCHGNECLKRKAFRRLRKTDIEGADVTCWGRLFQVRAAARGKARSPTVDSRVRQTFSVSEEEERRRLRVPKSAVYSSSSARYGGAVPCRHLYTTDRRTDSSIMPVADHTACSSASSSVACTRVVRTATNQPPP